ncbi:HAD family acid phosphatase [Actomonas aquatica]|uniref:HAD family acid phosphatase n=1 Tax=Actomonas aquatica TaxID=2866162 RepID=A0ABZ1C4V7_9BACT|nr:HAD family acid phosphatase [Opitutus sp. WL0086]WRQ86680.1 HAD family acid phosphatase [Opitutus sp. WL0086]
MFLLLAGVAAAEAPLNLTRAKAAVRAYYDTGAYHADVQAVADAATAWLEERVAARTADERLAMVFDIDETVLSNYQQMVSQDFGYVPVAWEQWVEQGTAAPLEPVRAVYRRARELGVAVIFLTGRSHDAEREGTLLNLERTGMTDYEQIIFKSDEDTAPTAAERKAARRAQLEAKGWTIIASIGDQESDLAGGHAEKLFKLPNPFYEIP